MSRHPFWQAFLTFACCVLLFWVADFRLFVGACFKIIGPLLFAGLLAFVVVHSPNISKLLAACLQTLPIARFPLIRRSTMRPHSREDIAHPNEPLLRLFQRPPPISFN